MKKGLNDRIDGILQCFSHVERDRTGKSMLECALVVVQWVGHGRDGLML